MTKLFMLGGALAGVALLRNKERRDRLFGQARDMLEKAKSRASDLADASKSSVAGASQTGRDNLGSSTAYGAFDDSDINRPRTYR